MHELNPHYDGTFPTIADAVDETHDSLLVSLNPFLGQGLEVGFDRFVDVSVPDRSYLAFPDATDPASFSPAASSKVDQYREFLLGEGAPLKNLADGIGWKLFGQRNEVSTATPVIDEINAEIREFRAEAARDSLVVANYMEAHAPFDPPDDAIRQFTDRPRIELPIRKSGRATREQYLSDPGYDASDMHTLYRASIWDLDRKVTPLIEELIADGTMVIVTADHGNWFRIDDQLEESRVHIPLVIFGPETAGEYVDHTVNLRHIARTTTEAIRRDTPSVENLPGEDLLDVDEDLFSFTEFIDSKKIGNLDRHPVQARGLPDDADEFYYFVSAIHGDSKIDYYHAEQEYREIRGSGHELEDLRSALERHVDREIAIGSGSAEYDSETEERLRQLGYLE